MVTEVQQHKILKVRVPDGKRVHRVRFYSDHPDCRPMSEAWPWPHPWWCTGSYDIEDKEGCVIVAYTEDVDALLKGWPEGRDFDVMESDLEYYTYTDRFQPADEWIEKTLPKVWGQWAHCGMSHKWQLIIREVRELLQDLKIDAVLDDHLTAPTPGIVVPDPTAADFVIWWMSAPECRSLTERMENGAFENWPEYLRAEIRSMHGRNPKGQLWVNPKHMAVCPNVPPEYLHRIDDNKGGICILIRDIKYVRSVPGVVTDFRLNVLESRVDFPDGTSVTKF